MLEFTRSVPQVSRPKERGGTKGRIRDRPMNRPLQKLNKEEVERLRKFYEYGPMMKRPIDEELAKKGWLQPNDIVDGEVRAYEASDAAYHKGIPILYNDAGVVKERWLIEK